MANDIKLTRGIVTTVCIQNILITPNGRAFARNDYPGYLFTYDGRAYGVHQPNRHEYWRVTDIASGRAICFSTTRKGAIDDFVARYADKMRAYATSRDYALIVAEFEAAAPYVTDEQVANLAKSATN